MALDLTPFDPAEYLSDADSIAVYLEDALADEDPNEFLEALGVVARAKDIRELAGDAGVVRPALHRSPEAIGHPDFATVLAVIKSLGLGVRIVPQAINSAPTAAGQ